MTAPGSDVTSGDERGLNRQDLLRRLLSFARAHHERLSAKVAHLGLTPMQAKALYFIEEVASMRRLADRLHCDASNVTGIVDRLEQLGLLERQGDITDRRVKRLFVTAAGRKVRAEVAGAMFDVPELDRLSASEERRLHQLIRKVWPESDAQTSDPPTA